MHCTISPCANYFYTGLLKGVSEDEVLLLDCEIVYETGDFSKSGWEDSQKIVFSNGQYVRINFIESFSKVEIIA